MNLKTLMTQSQTSAKKASREHFRVLVRYCKKRIKRTEKDMYTDTAMANLKPAFGDIEQILSELMNHVYSTPTVTKPETETFFLLFIKSVVLKAVYFKKQLLFQAGIAELDSLRNLLPQLEEAEKCDTIHYMVKVHLTYLSLYLHLRKFDLAIEHGRVGLELVMKEITLRFQRERVKNSNKARVYKVRRMFETTVLLFFDLGFAYEGKVRKVLNIILSYFQALYSQTLQHFILH